MEGGVEACFSWVLRSVLIHACVFVCVGDEKKLTSHSAVKALFSCQPERQVGRQDEQISHRLRGRGVHSLFQQHVTKHKPEETIILVQEE